MGRGDAHNLANAKTCSALSSASEWLLRGADKAEAIGVRFGQGSKGQAEALTEWGEPELPVHTRRKDTEVHKELRRLIYLHYLGAPLGLLCGLWATRER